MIAEFYDGGLPKANQEPAEIAEAIPEEPPRREAKAVREEESSKVVTLGGDAEASRATWPSPGRAFVSRESLRSRLL